MALDLSDSELLRVRAQERPEAVVSSGLAKLVDVAELRFQKAIDEPQVALARYAIERQQLERSVRALIADR